MIGSDYFPGKRRLTNSVTQRLSKAVTGEVDFGQNQLSGNATLQGVVRKDVDSFDRTKADVQLPINLLCGAL
jgi:hypothetical protein